MNKVCDLIPNLIKVEFENLGVVHLYFYIYILIREGPVSGNQEAAQTFIKYMYDIVLDISFLDINSQNWNTASHLKSGK